MKEYRVIVGLLAILFGGLAVDSCTRVVLAPPQPAAEFTTLNVSIANQTARVVHVFVERCGYSNRLVGAVLPYRTDTVRISSAEAPPGSAVSLLAYAVREPSERHNSELIALPLGQRTVLNVDWELRARRGRVQEAH